MTDTTVAPPSAAPTPAAPPSNEVVINQNPTNSPNPIGSQAPEAPENYRSPADSRKDAIKAAFDRANTPRDRTKPDATRDPPKAAKAERGHNRPPEDTPPIDLKKRPTDQPQAQPRDRGRFAPRAQGEDTGRQRSGLVNSGQTDLTNQPENTQPHKRLPPHAPFAEPPVRISERARQDWADTPESVRGDIHRWQGEFAKAYEYYKGDAEAFKPLKAFDKMARDGGTTLATAIGNYIGMENKLRADPVAALDVIVSNLGLKDPQTGHPIGLRDVAYYVLNRSPEQMRQVQQGNQQQAAAKQIGSLHQEIQGLKSTLHQMHTQQQFTYTRSAVDQFADSHPRFDELGDLIESELKFGFNLDQAYQRAELLRPATHAAQTRTTPAQTRPTDRSIRGAPDVAPSTGAPRRLQKASRTPHDAVANAVRRMNGG